MIIRIKITVTIADIPLPGSQSNFQACLLPSKPIMIMRITITVTLCQGRGNVHTRYHVPGKGKLKDQDRFLVISQ